MPQREWLATIRLLIRSSPMPQHPTATSHQPLIGASESPAEFTIKAIGLGVVFGILFGAANAYLGLRAGLTVSTSIPVAVMTVAMFKLLQRLGQDNSILEANLAQTTGSASSSGRRTT